MKKIKYSEILKDVHIKSIQQVLKKQGTLIYPTDTLYGLGGDFFSLQVMDKIDELKKREDIPYSVAVSGLEMLQDLVAEIPDVFYEFFGKIIPGRFTLLFKASPRINKILLKSSGKIGIRLPNLPDLLSLIEVLNTPLISTSVNHSGQKPLNNPDQMEKQFKSVDLLIDAGILPESLGSTVLDLTENPIKCIRKGDDFYKLIKLGIQMVVE
jgi:L-threonylcarbamoyladenylate synthase